MLLTALLLTSPIFAGDSLMVHVGQQAPPGTEVVAKVGSGLANPRLKDWSKVTFKANSKVVVILGTNDGQNIKGHPCGSKEWIVIYRTRVSELMSKVDSKNLLWVLPGQTGSTVLNRNLKFVRQAIMAEAFLHQVQVLDLRVILEEPERFNPKYHSGDRIHFNQAGVKKVRQEIEVWLNK